MPSFVCHAKPSKKMVVITVNTGTLEEFLSSGEIKGLADNGAIGLMCSRSNGRNNFYKSCITLGAGENGEAPYSSLECLKAYGPVISKYKSLTLAPCNEGAIVNLSINRLKYINSDTLYNAKPGKLGQVLRSNGIRTMFIGGFWSEGSIKSPAFFIIMDNFGLSDLGETTGVLNESGIDTTKLVEAFKSNMDTAGFTVIELGSMEKLYMDRYLYSHESYKIARNTAIQETGKTIDLIKNSIDFNTTTLCILSSYSTDDREGAGMLSPVIIYDGGKSKGILASNTTRRNGVISALDFAPFVVNYFGIDAKGFIGQNLYAVNSPESGYISTLNKKINSISIYRSPLLKGFAVSIILVLIIYFLKIIKSCYSIFLLKTIILIPLSMLLESFFVFTNPGFKVIFILFVSVVMSMVLSKMFKNTIDYIGMVSFLSVLILCLDIICGQNLLKYSIFSYDPVIGARFYGMGNEYLGVMASCSLLFCSSTFEKGKVKEPPIIFILLLILFITGLPMLGANTGGFITCAAGFMMFMLLEYNLNLISSLKIVAIVSLTALLLLILVNLITQDMQSHLGRLFIMMQSEGISYGINMFLRKKDMALKLIRYTIWSWVLLALIIAGVVNAYKSAKYSKVMFQGFTHFKKSWVSLICSSFIAILTNDSGIVTAAVIMLYAVCGNILLFGKKNGVV
jgi:hypothetical protein